VSERESYLVAIVYDDEYKADEARLILRRAQGEGLIELVETAVIVKSREGKPRLYQDVDLVATRKNQGHWIGVVAAVVTETQPLVLAGTVAGALIGRLTDTGITTGDMKTIGEQLIPGTSALFVLAKRTEHRDAILRRLGPLGGKIAQTTLSAASEDALARALEQASS
jgi:uncharacterized membrane protein